jgi:hypothetical protein
MGNILNTLTLNTGALKYTRETVTDLKGRTHSNTITIGNFSTICTATDHKEGNNSHNCTLGQNGPNRYLQNTSTSYQIHIFS